ncbi:hypothetical protein B0T24DRAFT_115978 [Lasiosphaeria ovina]|uniref:Secreted protein n=1 Tax=Lasiosphaeria ovina TaxID=92902 RepID=A0AAE0MY29_9PEZI|nr:hypothetical protein B0T24DRAFT_115978 [Lasiosphaeria ovina]
MVSVIVLALALSFGLLCCPTRICNVSPPTSRPSRRSNGFLPLPLFFPSSLGPGANRRSLAALGLPARANEGTGKE